MTFSEEKAPAEIRGYFSKISGFWEAFFLAQNRRRASTQKSTAKLKSKLESFAAKIHKDLPLIQQFTYGVVQEGVIAEKFPHLSAKFLQNFRTLSRRNATYFLRKFRELSTEFPQKNPALRTPYPKDPPVLFSIRGPIP